MGALEPGLLLTTRRLCSKVWWWMASGWGSARCGHLLAIDFSFYDLLAITEESGNWGRGGLLMDGLCVAGADGGAFVLEVRALVADGPSIMGTCNQRSRDAPVGECYAFLLDLPGPPHLYFSWQLFLPRGHGGHLGWFCSALSDEFSKLQGSPGLIFKRAYPSQEAFALDFLPT